MITKVWAKIAVKKLNDEHNRIGKARDHLDGTIQELEQLKADYEEAMECLQQARDALSRLV